MMFGLVALTTLIHPYHKEIGAFALSSRPRKYCVSGKGGVQLWSTALMLNPFALENGGVRADVGRSTFFAFCF
jgi:hypothetical protein